MKICPHCNNRYTDDTLKFCLQDGAALIDDGDDQSSAPTVAISEEQATVVRNRPNERINFDLQNTAQTEHRPTQPTTVNYQDEPKKSNTALIVLATALATLLIAAIGVAGWLYMRNKNETAKSENVKVAVENTAKPTATPTAKPTAKPTATPTATPSFDAAELKAEVSKSVNAWRAATESFDLDEYMTHYAPTVDYYNKKQVGVATVRADKEKAFSNYDTLRVTLGNITVMPDASGENATAVFDKEWYFENPSKISEGKVQTQLQMKKISGDWKITGEKDLKVYYAK